MKYTRNNVAACRIRFHDLKAFYAINEKRLPA